MPARGRPPWWPVDEPWPPPRGWRRHGPPWFVPVLALVLLLAIATKSPHVFFAAVSIGLLVLALSVMVVMGRAFGRMNRRLGSIQAGRRSMLADTAHELRTPLAVIRANAEAVADGVYPGDRDHMAPILEATRSLEVLVDGLQTLALSEVGALELKREPCDLAALARDAVAAFRAQAEKAGVSLSVTSSGPTTVEGDPARLSAVISNLLANGLRHTPSGGSVTVTVAGTSLTVADTGSGIPADLMPHVFERFARGPGGGSGLGLAIARDVVTAHGGRITIDTQPGQGTAVRFELPR